MDLVRVFSPHRFCFVFGWTLPLDSRLVSDAARRCDPRVFLGEMLFGRDTPLKWPALVF